MEWKKYETKENNKKSDWRIRERIKEIHRMKRGKKKDRRRRDERRRRK